jgi:hypothetical protein
MIREVDCCFMFAEIKTCCLHEKAVTGDMKNLKIYQQATKHLCTKHLAPLRYNVD